MRDIACELALPVDRERLRRVAGIVEDFDFARLDNEELEQTIADVNEGFAIAILFWRDVVQLANWAIWSASRTGKAMEWRVCSAMADLLTPAPRIPSRSSCRKDRSDLSRPSPKRRFQFRACDVPIRETPELGERHWIRSLQIREPASFGRVVCQFVLGQYCFWDCISSHLNSPSPFLPRYDLPIIPLCQTYENPTDVQRPPLCV